MQGLIQSMVKAEEEMDQTRAIAAGDRRGTSYAYVMIMMMITGGSTVAVPDQE